MKHQGSKVIETDRLLLRPFTMDDAQAMYDNWASDPQVTRYMTWQAYQSVEEAVETLSKWTAQYSKDNFYLWAICLINQTETVIGSISIGAINEHLESAEIGYCIGQNFWNQGITTEALQAMIGYLFEEVGFYRLSALHRLENPASGKVMEKVGMEYEGHLRGSGKDNQGQFVDLKQYAILRGDWHKD